MFINKYDLLVTIIGRSNSGKSLLFNRILNSNISLISNDIGTTIDRKYGHIFFKNIKIGFIDNAALDFPNKYLYKSILNQIIFSINVSNIILFIIDYSIKYIDEDIKILNFLKYFNKKILIVFNKIDLIKDKKNYSSFKNINKIKNINITYISSLFNKGIKKLINSIYTFFKEKKIYNTKHIYFSKNNFIEDNKYIKLTIIGKQNSGKSTFINSILNENRIITSDIPGTTKDSIDVYLKYKNINLIITDTAGIKNINIFNKNKNSSNYINKLNYIILNKIEKSNIIMFFIDISNGISDKDILLINNFIKLEKLILILINKCDLFYKKKFNLIKKNIYKKLSFLKFIKIIFISSLYKYNFNKIFKFIELSNINFNKKFKNKFLNKILIKLINNKEHKLINNKKPKLKFCKINNNYPLKIIIFGKKTYLLEKNYKKYIINNFYKYLKCKNIPLYIIYKEI